ncbi:MAG: hypothetical protein ACI81P_003095, partial [Neolewinella sp.]
MGELRKERIYVHSVIHTFNYSFIHLPMTAYILTIGDEILIGQVTDTNATYMANALNDEG